MKGAAMLDRLKALFEGDPGPSGSHDEVDITLAAAALLVEVAMMDGVFEGAERERIGQLLAWRFKLGEDATAELITRAEAAVAKASGLHGFVKIVIAHFSVSERTRLIEMLWDVTYADGDLHDHEAGIIRKLAGLLHVPDGMSGAARKRAAARHGAPEAG